TLPSPGRVALLNAPSPRTVIRGLDGETRSCRRVSSSKVDVIFGRVFPIVGIDVREAAVHKLGVLIFDEPSDPVVYFRSYQHIFLVRLGIGDPDRSGLQLLLG